MMLIPAVNRWDLYKRDEEICQSQAGVGLLGIECNDWIWITSSLSTLKGIGYKASGQFIFRRCSVDC